MFKNKREIRAVLLAGAALCCMAGSVQAQGRPGQGQPVQQNGQAGAAGQIENVLITGFLEQDLPETLSQLGTRVDVVTATDIKNGGYLDVTQALQVTVPGLYIAPQSGPFDYVDLSLQGSRTSDVLWTVDGVRINNRLYAGTTPLDTLPASMIERIEVLEGPQTLFYGTQAVAGAINIITKDFSDRPDGQFSVGGDTNSGRHMDGYFRDTLGKNHFVVYGSADKSEGYQPFRTRDFQPSQTDRDRSYEVMTIGGKYAVDLSDAFRVTLSEQHTDAKLDTIYPQGALQAYNERNEDILTAKVDYRASNDLQFFVKGYYHWWYAHYTEFDNDIQDDPTVLVPPVGSLLGSVSVSDNHDFWGFTDYGLNAMTKFTPGRGIETYLGYDYQSYNGNDVVLVITPKTEHVHAVFGEIATTRDLLPDAQFAAGFRYNAPSVGQNAFVWNVTGRYDVMPGTLYVKGMVGTAFRLPTAEELFANDPNDERGNPNIKPETSFNANGSIGGALGMMGLRWEAVGFYRDIKNMIDLDTFDSVTNQDVFGNVAGRVRTTGFEFILDAALSSDFSASASFTVSETKNTITHLQVNRIPEQLGKLIVDYHPTDQIFGLFASLNYVGTIHDAPGGIRTKFGDYAVIDAGGRVFLDMNRHHRFDLGIHNLFDQNYTTRLTRGFPDDQSAAYVTGKLGLPRTFYASYTYSFF